MLKLEDFADDGARPRLHRTNSSPPIPWLATLVGGLAAAMATGVLLGSLGFVAWRTFCFWNRMTGNA